ncbi:hypothetical protein KY320_00175 [Candidatus Woesearchaeota archaeon]|nr:hypothetical protein [Candidatus Woesearchaeota archaeon]
MKQLLFSLFILVYAFTVNAQGLGVSPSKLDIEIYRGEQAESSFLIVNPTHEELSYKVLNQDYPAWFRFEPSSGRLKPGETKLIKLYVKPDALAPNAEYNTLIEVILQNGNTQPGVALDIGLAIKTKISVSGKQTIHAQVNDIVIEDIEQTNPLVIRVDITNYGNVRIKPVIRCAVNRNNRTVDRFDIEFEEVLPNSRKTLTVIHENNFELGAYDTFVQIETGNNIVAEKEVVFKVLPYNNKLPVVESHQKLIIHGVDGSEQPSIITGILLVAVIIGLGIGIYYVIIMGGYTTTE